MINKHFVITVLIIYMIPITLGIFCMSLPTVLGQTPSATTTIQGNNNLPSSIEFIPQKAIITTLPPAGENIPQNNASSGSNDGIWGTVMALGTAAFAIYTKISAKRDHDKNKERTQDIAATQVKVVGVQQEHLGLTYDNMPNKGNEINNRPEIRLANVEAIKQEALDNAKKA